jgi:signal transduction histidine kinase
MSSTFAEASDRLLRAADPILVWALIAVAAAQALAAPIASRPVSLGIALLTTVPLLARRSHPVAAAMLSTAAGLVPSHGYVYVGYVAAFVLFYSVAAHVDDPRTVGLTVAAGCGLAVAGSWIHGAVFGDYFAALSAVVAPAIVGRFVRHQRAQAARLRELAADLEREREHRVAAALSDERARIARELHDVIAHQVSVIAIQADAAEAALDVDPGRAQPPLAAIRAAAQDALSEMRRLLTVLRDPGDDVDPTAPQPGLAQLPELVERACGLGIPVSLEQRGEPVPLPAGVDLSAYRILQEALTNVHKHAADAATHITVCWWTDRIELDVLDEGGGVERDGQPATGHGLVGMRERARLLGGSLAAGTVNGGFRVHAVLPIGGDG